MASLRLTALEVASCTLNGNIHAYIDAFEGEISEKTDVVEPMRVVRTAVQGATDTACMILRIDNIVTAKEPDEFGV